jgi:hypothetical protein
MNPKSIQIRSRQKTASRAFAMHIKHLAIQGFKSYKDQVVTEPFSPRHNVVGELHAGARVAWPGSRGIPRSRRTLHRQAASAARTQGGAPT